MQTRTKLAALALFVLASGGAARAAAVTSTPSSPSSSSSSAAASTTPASTRTTRDGIVAQVLVSPRGDVDGLLLRDGSLVRFPPHTLTDASSLRVGMKVHVEGEAATNAGVLTVFHAQLTADGRALTTEDADPPHRRQHGPEGRGERGARGPREGDEARPELSAVSAHGIVRTLLANPRNDVDGFILDDGTVVRAGPHAKLASLGVAVGAAVTVEGRGGSYPQGRSIHAASLQVGSGAMVALPKHGKHEGRGPHGQPPDAPEALAQ